MKKLMIGLLISLGSLAKANGNGNTYYFLDCLLEQSEYGITVGSRKMDLGIHAQSGDFILNGNPSFNDVQAKVTINQLGYKDSYLTKVSFQIFDPTDSESKVESANMTIDAWKGTEKGEYVQFLDLYTKAGNSYQLRCFQYSEFEED